VSKALVILASRAERERAAKWCMTAPTNTRVEFKESRRSVDQNAALWRALTIIASAHRWHGLKLTAEDWKDLFSAGLKRELRTVPNLDGNGFVALGMRTSDMTKAEFSELLELVFAFAAREGIDLGIDEKH
jgi:hypothetical protein